MTAIMSVLKVDCTNLQSNPCCPHGPMVKFTKSVQGKLRQYFGCTACRNPKDCPFSLKTGERFSADKLKILADAKRQMAPSLSSSESANLLGKFKELKVKNRKFCRSCFAFVFPHELSVHRDHDVVDNVTDSMLDCPSQFISAKTNDKIEAQYWFDDNSKRFVLSMLEKLKALSILCIGTPTVFEMVRNSRMKCMLLDIDPRYMTFYSSEEFGWFNMLNCHFLANETEGMENLKRSLTNDRVVIVLDPPFGARLELLSYSINQLRRMTFGVCMIFLALPYFMEPQVTKYLPDFQMLDYVLHYANHSKMKSHKKSSVRFFTNVSPQMIQLPRSEGYKLCKKCNVWRHPSNEHCDACGTCPGKNATTYKHCRLCNICVKSTWDHCQSCQRCFLTPHKCFDKAKTSLKRPKISKQSRKKKKVN